MSIDGVPGTILGCLENSLHLYLKGKYYCLYFTEAEIGTQQDRVVKTEYNSVFWAFILLIFLLGQRLLVPINSYDLCTGNHGMLQFIIMTICPR